MIYEANVGSMILLKVDMAYMMIPQVGVTSRILLRTIMGSTKSMCRI